MSIVENWRVVFGSNDEEEAERPPFCNYTEKWRRPCAESGLLWVEPLPKTAAYVYIYLEFY